ncbi:hypothetical protein GOP47_0007260 [Adiantum capillus-veneris]|uniref:Uncharacterized protein n=1 Tax=Adiantum capillus-veneris TaxID=13818 RepID=A0A9D4V0Y6_ADICA|nr:hypothetical protein GOP47_0007260 [Adiantum capillus-veneris]
MGSMASPDTFEVEGPGVATYVEKGPWQTCTKSIMDGLTGSSLSLNISPASSATPPLSAYITSDFRIKLVNKSKGVCQWKLLL